MKQSGFKAFAAEHKILLLIKLSFNSKCQFTRAQKSLTNSMHSFNEDYLLQNFENFIHASYLQSRAQFCCKKWRTPWCETNAVIGSMQK